MFYNHSEIVMQYHNIKLLKIHHPGVNDNNSESNIRGP